MAARGTVATSGSGDGIAVRPRVSVVLGTYNRRPFLELAVESVRRNGAACQYELIVVDGGSTDGTIAWLAEQKDVITIIQHNRGSFRGKPLRRRSWGYFMNLAFKAAQGEYVLMMSDDCLLLPGAIDAGVAAFARRDGSGTSPVGGAAFYYRNWPREPEYYVQHTLGGMLMVNHGMYLREALERVNWADEDRYIFYKCDGDLSLKIWQAGFEIVDCRSAIVEHYDAANLEVRQSNVDVLAHDRDAYLARWEGIFWDPETPELRGRQFLSFEDPNRTADRFLSAERAEQQGANGAAAAAAVSGSSPVGEASGRPAAVAPQAGTSARAARPPAPGRVPIWLTNSLRRLRSLAGP